MALNGKNTKRGREVFPEEIFLDSSNLPRFDVHQFEGRLERPLSRAILLGITAIFLFIGALFLARLWQLQVVEGSEFAKRSETNRLRYSLFFTERGVIFDRHGTPLTWNEDSVDGVDFLKRRYIEKSGFAHVLGYVQYPAKDKQGFYFNTEYAGIDGVEKYYNESLRGSNGLKIIETNAVGDVVSENTIEKPVAGDPLTLSLDADIQAKLHDIIRSTAVNVGFTGGAGALIDISSGEIIALTSYPEYDSSVLSDGDDVEKINMVVSDPRTPFLNRITNGLYTPGSIVKPFIAMGALEEGIISPEKTIISTGKISIPNPYDSKKESVFADWRAHGAVDMRRALAVSSNVYFYEIGGGFEGQQGLGIDRIEQYMKLFGFGTPHSLAFFESPSGLIPTPIWKEAIFHDPWRIGDTYHTAIGQYGFQVTPLQVLLGVTAIANDGFVPELSIIKRADSPASYFTLDFSKEHFGVIRDGMRQGVTEGTASALYLPTLAIAAKTGTAELGVDKQFVNSWVTGFLPYENPRYAFVVVMEHGPRQNLIGAAAVARQFFEWVIEVNNRLVGVQ